MNTDVITTKTLMWQTLLVGQQIDQPAVTSLKLNFYQAQLAASGNNLLGYRDWRISTLWELVGNDYQIKQEYDAWIWSTTPLRNGNNNTVWTANYYIQHSAWLDKDCTCSVLLVRSM